MGMGNMDVSRKDNKKSSQKSDKEFSLENSLEIILFILPLNNNVSLVLYPQISSLIKIRFSCKPILYF